MTSAQAMSLGQTQNEETAAPSLLKLMSDGFYALLLIKRGRAPTDRQAFLDSMKQFLSGFERAASRQNFSNTDIHAVKYAYCALVDEAVLRSDCSFREEWGRSPLQLELFGDHLAGENFFSRLEELRTQGEARLASLEVYHFCLLLGFQGKYLIEGVEKLHYLTARLGDEIVFLKGKRTGFAPHWARPDAVAHVLRRSVPVWVVALVLLVAGMIAYTSLRISLGQSAESALAPFNQIVEMPAKTANVTITLP